MSARTRNTRGILSAKPARIANIAGVTALAAITVLVACESAPRQAANHTGPPSVITILAPAGRFATPEAAAGAADSIDWWDDDPTDDDASTSGFAALELREFLPALSGLSAEQVRISGAATLPAAGDVIVLSTASVPGAGVRLSALLGRAGEAAHRRAAPRTPARHPDGFRLATFSLGGRRVAVITGAGRTGTLYGAHALLESMGVRFDGLGEAGTILPPAPVQIPARLAMREEPAYDTRGFWAWEARGEEPFFRWMARNRMNLWTAVEPHHGRLAQLGLQLTAGGHSVQSDFISPHAPFPFDAATWKGDEHLPRDPYTPGALVDSNRDGRLTYFEAHPEWFGLREGTRRDDIAGEVGTNFCTSNPDASRELARNLIRALRDGTLRHADQLNLWPLDNGSWCECEPCRAQGRPADRWLAVLARVNLEVARARQSGELKRRPLLVAPAYLETRNPPKHPVARGDSIAGTMITFFPYFRCYAHPFIGSTCREVNGTLAPHLEGWAHALDPPAARRGPEHPRAALGIGEYYNVSWHKSMPLMFTRAMTADLFAYHALGARHFHTMHAPTRAWGTWALNHHVLAKLLWHPASDTDSLVDAFVRRQHPSAPEAMKTFYSALEQATANVTSIQGTIGSIGTGNGRLMNPSYPVFQLRHFQLMTSVIGPDSAASLAAVAEAIVRARAAFESARAATVEPRERARLEEIGRRFDYGENVFRLYAGVFETILLHRQNDTARARASFASVRQTAERLREVIDLVQVSSVHSNATDGFEASQIKQVYEFLRERYGAAAQ